MKKESNNIKISFGIIVLNGEPFTKYCLRSLYPFAHEIIVVEGATKNAASISTIDGHSTDRTLAALKEFKEQEDPENKIKIITNNGFWTEKDEMSEAYAKIASGNVLWQVDIDEFYKAEDIQKIILLLEENPSIKTISLNTLTFWGSIDYTTDGWHLMRGAKEYHRIFRFGPGFTYKTHRPPTVLDPNGIDLRKIDSGKGWMHGNKLENNYGIVMYHYSLVFPKQIEEKAKYYSAWARKESVAWAENNYGKLAHPFHVHNVYEQVSWLEKYRGTHPTEIIHMTLDIEENKNGMGETKLRDMHDVQKLFSNPVYPLSAWILKTTGKILVLKQYIGKKIKK